MIAEGFAGTASKEQVDRRFGQVDKRFDTLGQRFEVLERKVDRALYQDLDRHERWIKQLADKVGAELSR